MCDRSEEDKVPGKEVPDDNWKHRQHGLRCHSCIWFVFKETTTGKPNHLGRCRKHAPTIIGFPPVFGTDWCGDHRLDENKI